MPPHDPSRATTVAQLPDEAPPSGSTGLVRAALMRRCIAASLERIWENVLDWEHLPWLHRESFAWIERERCGDWGWRAHAAGRDAPDDAFVVELRIDHEAGRYIVQTVEGRGAGTEIWTGLTPRDAHATDIDVAFWIPTVADPLREQIGQGLLALYQQLWDEDERMMQQRERSLRSRARPAPGSAHPVGRVEELRQRLPLCIRIEGHPYRLLELDGELLAHSMVCPHRSGPLDGDDDAELPHHEVRCPWHGYRFDVRSGRSCDGHSLRLERAPRVTVEDGEVLLHFDPGAS